MKVGFIGLGVMGSAMARNLLKAGRELTVYNRTRARAEQMARDGAKVAASPAETASGEVVITMLADDHAVKDVLLGSGNLLSKLRPDQVHVSMSTISVELARNLVEAHHDQGTGFVSAPVFGRPEVAAAAQLFVIAAGPKSAVAKCEPLFAAMGKKTFMTSRISHTSKRRSCGAPTVTCATRQRAPTAPTIVPRRNCWLTGTASERR
jgi:3-hydroxyisobutyrate dehydrogenase-like beta-hydroxyacid dehydrogenase